MEQGNIFFEQYNKLINNIIKEKEKQNVKCILYIASDTDIAISYFKEKYGDIVYYNNFKRTTYDDMLNWIYELSKNNRTIDPGHGFVNNKGVELQQLLSDKNESNSKYGKEVLIDTILLSKMDYFIHTVSNLALSISYINP